MSPYVLHRSLCRSIIRIIRTIGEEPLDQFFFFYIFLFCLNLLASWQTIWEDSHFLLGHSVDEAGRSRMRRCRIQITGALRRKKLLYTSAHCPYPCLERSGGRANGAVKPYVCVNYSPGKEISLSVAPLLGRPQLTWCLAWVVLLLWVVSLGGRASKPHIKASTRLSL